jgi:pimeloyl-ACP methyl ester carboxylesterase
MPAASRQTKRLGFRIGRILLALLVILLALPLAGAAYEAAMASGDAARYPAPGRLIDVGGYRLHLHCIGEGSPTVVLISGHGGFTPEWSLVQPELARSNRVCTADRAGLGWSEEGTHGHSPGAAADDLARLLAAGGEHGPYLLVGQSWGGKEARLFAQRNPDDVAGMVLVDARSEYIDDHQTPEMVENEWAEVSDYQNMLGSMGPIGVIRLIWADSWPDFLPVAAKLPRATRETIGVLQSKPAHRAAALRESAELRLENGELRNASLGNLPLVVIAAGKTIEAWPDWSDSQRYQASLSSNSRFLLTEGSDHMVQWDKPEVVVEAVKIVAEAAPMAGR